MNVVAPQSADPSSPTCTGIDVENKILKLDNTALDDWRTCPMKFNEKIVKGLAVMSEEGVETPPLDLHYGSAWHEAMQPLYEDYNLEAGIEIWEEKTQGMEEDPKRRKTIGRGVRDLQEYWERYGDEIRRVHLIDQEILATMLIDLPESDWRVSYIGAIDKLFRTDQGEIRVRDHKTSGYVSVNTGVGYELSNQLIGYAQIVRTLYGIDNDTPIYADADIVGITRVNPPSEFLQPEIEVSYEKGLEWTAEIRETAYHIIRALDTGIWPKHGEKSCTAWGRSCPFIPVCTAPASMRSTVEEVEYVEMRWDPAER